MNYFTQALRDLVEDNKPKSLWGKYEPKRRVWLTPKQYDALTPEKIEQYARDGTELGIDTNLRDPQEDHRWDREQSELATEYQDNDRDGARS